MSALRRQERQDGAVVRTVERELEFELVQPSRPGAPHPVGVPTRLLYRTDEPGSVRLAFHIDSGAPVEWVVERDLLIEGVFRPTGEGEVQVWPSRGDGCRPLVCLALDSPFGRAVLCAPIEPVKAWLERTVILVPPTEDPVPPPASDGDGPG
ncbi:hypothetical protein RKD26_006478 [Streptomyces calvus]